MFCYWTPQLKCKCRANGGPDSPQSLRGSCRLNVLFSSAHFQTHVKYIGFKTHWPRSTNKSRRTHGDDSRLRGLAWPGARFIFLGRFRDDRAPNAFRWSLQRLFFLCVICLIECVTCATICHEGKQTAAEVIFIGRLEVDHTELPPCQFGDRATCKLSTLQFDGRWRV